METMNDQTHETRQESEMNNATIILLIGILYAMIISPWWIGLLSGMALALVCCIVTDLVAWATRKAMGR